jgi:hypothetical protein
VFTAAVNRCATQKQSFDTATRLKPIFRINNLGENYRQIFGFKGLTDNIFKNQ